MSCQTCSSELTIQNQKISFITPCCSTLICNNCINKNPRLKEYIPCLRCGDPRTSELKGSSSYNIKRNTNRNNQSQSNDTSSRDIIGSQGEIVFEIGDSDDDDDDDDDEVQEDLPPNYDDILRSESDTTPNENVDHDDNKQSKLNDTITRNTPELPHQNTELVDEDQYETVEITHKIQRNDTILSISRKYATDPHELLSLNNLPHTAITTNPRIIQTRKSLIISKRKVLKSKLDSNQNKINPSINDDDDNKQDEIDELDEQKRKQKQIKRFQLLTKSNDLGIVNTYLSLSELDENKDIQGTGESLSSNQSKKKALIPDKHNREQRALDQFFDDEQWELDQSQNYQELRKNKGKETEKNSGKWNIFGGNRNISVKS
ncbi:uncharacterized protein L201_008095 [Kwoniella dendrophila CBS 6074]|uniref:LysM domain-containing protein n=1 Tax=Kwoniella dendrophila CBS 6074 TaxID=1295534 RepID=A0AAX4K7Q1_9TREE